MQTILKTMTDSLASFAIIVGSMGAPSAVAAQSPHEKVQAVIATIRVLQRPHQINLATIWDGNKYVQCRRHMNDDSLLCEAAGSLMQSSMSYVLTPEHIGKLAVLDWRYDPSFGNYVHTFPADMPNGAVADGILVAMSQGYDARLESLEVATQSVADDPCPPRHGPSQNLAGAIDNSREMRPHSVYSCAYRPDLSEPVQKLTPNSTASDLIEVLGPRVTAEIMRLRVNLHESRVFVTFDAGIGYIQCETEPYPDSFYCEAQSAESWPALAAVLTPPRIAALHAAGYSDPGRTQNYSKSYPVDRITDAALASEVLTLLHDVYGYNGASDLRIGTEATQ